MRIQRIILFSLAATLAMQAQSGSSASQTIRISIQPANNIKVDRPNLAMSIATAGKHSFGRAEDRLALGNHTSGRKISASLHAPLPKGSRLFVLVGGGSGTSVGQVEFQDASRTLDVVTDLGPGKTNDRSIEYTLTADASTRSLASATPNVIYTLTD